MKVYPPNAGPLARAAGGKQLPFDGGFLYRLGSNNR